MNPKKRQTALLAAVLLLVFAAAKFAALYWYSQQENAHGIRVACGAQSPCRLPDGVLLDFQPALRAPFDIRLHHVPANAQRVYIQFSMENMDMGFNRFDLKPQNQAGQWLAQNVRLPVCTDNRRDYLATIHIDGKQYQLAFEAH